MTSIHSPLFFYQGINWSLGAPYYQFINTGAPTNTISKPGHSYLITLGSGVAFKLPTVPTNGNLLDWSKVKPIPTGSTFESSPSNEWPFYAPSSVASQYISRTQLVNQVQNIPEPVYSAYRLNKKKPYARTMYSWTSRQGFPRQMCAYMPVPGLLEGDIEYDLTPAQMKTGAKKLYMRSPDADWPHDACIVSVQHEEFGQRTFIIMTDAQSKFYCWPTQYDGNESLVPGGSPYIDQAIKTNVPDYQVRSTFPPYPSWVHTVTTQFRDQFIADNGVQSLDPRYIWRFSPYGDKVVGIALERTETTYEVFAQSGLSAQYSIGDAAVYDKQQVGGDYNSTSPIKMDLPGFIEFSLDITITGPNKEDFTFDMQLLRSQKANGVDYPIAAGYLFPFPDGTWLDRNVTLADTGDLIIAYLKIGASAEYLDHIKKYDHYGTSVEFLFSKCWLDIKKYNYETSIAIIPLWESEELSASPNIPYSTQYQAFISHLDLSTLSWVLRLQKHNFEIEDSPFTTSTGSLNVPVNVYKEVRSTECAVHYTVWNKQEKRETVGQSLNLFTWFDSFTVDSELLNLEQKGTYWINRSGLIAQLYNSNNHWLFDKVTYLLGQGLAQARLDLSDPLFIPANKSEFSTEVMSNVLDLLGGHSAILAMNNDYTVDYWNTLVVDFFWDVFSSAVVRKNAGDVSSLVPGDAGNYLSCYQEFDFSAPFEHDSTKLTCFSDSNYLKRIYDMDVGQLYYAAALRNSVYNMGSGFELVVSDRGFMSGYFGLIYANDPITSRVVFKAQGSGKLQSKTIFGNVSECATTFYGNYSSLVPSNSVIRTKHIDFIKHVRGGDELKHIDLYNQAYGRFQTETSHDLQLNVEVISGYVVVYSVSQKIKVDGSDYYILQYQDTNHFNTDYRNIYLSRVNGSSLYVG